jgi:hypothetical protein
MNPKNVLKIVAKSRKCEKGWTWEQNDKVTQSKTLLSFCVSENFFWLHWNPQNLLKLFPHQKSFANFNLAEFLSIFFSDAKK